MVITVQGRNHTPPVYAELHRSENVVHLPITLRRAARWLSSRGARGAKFAGVLTEVGA